MKNRTLTISLLFVILTTVLSSCGNLLYTDIASPEKEQQSKNTATITGSFTSDIPGIGAAKTTQTRAAYPSSFNKNDYDLSVYAIDVMNDVKAEGAITGDTFKIAGLTIGNTYKICIEFSYYDSWNERYYIILSGESDPVTISEERTSVPAISLSFPTLTKDTSQFIPLQGSFDVIFRYTGSTYANFWDYATNYIVSGIDNSLAGPDIDIIQGNDFKIYYTGLYSGIHHITIMFANQIFLIDEDLYVYPYMTTDTWVSSDTNNVEGNVFKITDEMIEQYQKNTFYVDSHQTENGNGTYWSPFNTIDTAFQYAVTNLSSNVRIFIKDGSELTASGDYQNLDFNYKNFTMEAYTDTPGDKKGTASITFTNETASIFHLQNTSTFNVTGINFFGGDSYSSDGEGGFFDIDSGSTATFTNCSFTNGKSGSSGGAIANNGTCTLNGCTFSNNQAETAGGAIFSTGTLTISGTTTIENNIADGNKYEFLSFYGNLTLDGTLNFKDSERFEFHKGNDSYAASSVTLGNNLSVTGSGISKIPLYYDSESNGGTSILNQCFFASGSESWAATYFSVSAGSTTYIINDSGEIKKNGTVSLTYNGSTDQYSTLNDAFGIISSISLFSNTSTTSTITLEAGSTYEITDWISISKADVTITVSGSGKATIKVNDDCTSLVPFKLEENATLTAQNIIFTSSSYVATYNAGYFELLKDTSKATFTNCTFENGKCIYDERYNSAGAIYCQLGELILDGCTFTNNKNNWNSTAQSGDANDIYLTDGIITLKNQNTFSGPIIIQMDYYHYVGDYSKALSSYIVLESISLSEGKTTYADFVFATVSESGMHNPLIIDGLTETTQSWFPCTMPSGSEDYFIDSDGKLQKYSEATTLYVGSNGSDSESGYGYSAAKPFATLQHALGQCDSTTSKTIWVEASSTPEDITQILISGKKADIKVTNDLTSNTIGGTKAYNFINQGSDGQFQINTNSKISFTGFIFTRTNNVGSGGFIGTASSEVSFTNCKFQGATANENGGAIVNGSGTKLILDNCEFTNCTATTKNGGAIYNSGELILSNCTFSGNKASSVSNDIYHTGSSVTLKAGNIFDGGIKLVSGSTIEIGEELSSSNAKIPVAVGSIPTGTTILDGDGMASALSNDLIVLDTTLFGIDVYGRLQQIVIPETVYIDSNSGLNIPGYGTAEKPFKTLEFVLNHGTPSTVKIKSGHSETSGTISVEADLTIEVYDNFGDTEQTSEGTATIDFKENAYFTVADEDLILNINHITFQRSTPIEGVSGGLILAYSSNYTFTKCTFKSTVINENNGGLVCIDSPSTIVTFDTCKFIGGKTKENGGAIYNAGTLTVDSCTFETCYQNDDEDNYIFSSGSSSSTTLKGRIGTFFGSSSGYIELEKSASVLFYHVIHDELYGWPMGDSIYIKLDDGSNYECGTDNPFYKSMINPEQSDFSISADLSTLENYTFTQITENGYYCGYFL